MAPLERLFTAEMELLWARLSSASRDRASLQALWSRDGDPRVTRLVQSAAYAFARVREKLEDDIPELSHAMVATALPEVLRPYPSATIVELQDPRRTRRNVSDAAPGRILESREVGGAPCTFVTSWPVTLSPITLERARIGALHAGVNELSLHLAPYPGLPLAAALPDSLRIFVRTADSLAALDVVRAACARRDPLRLRGFGADGVELAARELLDPVVRWTALEPGCALTRAPADRFGSATLLRTLFGFPEAFGFMDVEGVRAAAASMGPLVRSLELTLPLTGSLGDGAFDATFHLHCAPATNAFEARTVPLPVRALGPVGVFAVAGTARRELLHIDRAELVPDGAPDRPLAVSLWERSDSVAHGDHDLFLKIERRGEDVRGELCRPNGAPGVPRGTLVLSVIATDGRRTDGLLVGDVGTNITRVSPHRPLVIDGHLPWRANAFARMPAASFANASSMGAYLDMHDVARSHEPGTQSSPRNRGVLAVSRDRATRVLGDEVHHGERIDLQLDAAAFGGAGATWLVGELLARAIAERTDVLRFARITNNDMGIDYGNRPGQKLPPPFG